MSDNFERKVQYVMDHNQPNIIQTAISMTIFTQYLHFVGSPLASMTECSLCCQPDSSQFKLYSEQYILY